MDTSSTGDPDAPWEPLTIRELVDLLSGVRHPWWIAGGQAIDLFVGQETREHADIDVLIRRPDTDVMLATLSGWEAYACDPPGSLKPMGPEYRMPEHVHDIWVRRAGSRSWSLQFLIFDVANGEWLFRRRPSIRRPVADIGLVSEGVAYLRPEIQLLYKSNGLREKDEFDFRSALPLLDGAARNWLAKSLQAIDRSHHWLADLRAAQASEGAL